MILSGKKGIIFGALDERSIAWHVAKRCLDEGAALVLTNTAQAIQLGDIQRLAEAHRLPLIACDATQPEDLRALLEQAQTLLGGKTDFILHAAAQSMNLRRHKAYEEANYRYFQQTIDASALSLHKLLRTAMELDAIAEQGSVVALSYIASERFLQGYNDMADAKAVLQAITRNFGYIYGRRRHVRVNAVSQSPTPTTAGQGIAGMEGMLQYADNCSPLGNATAEDCAALVTALFSDLTRKVTMQTIYNDGGFSSVLPNPLA